MKVKPTFTWLTSLSPAIRYVVSRRRYSTPQEIWAEALCWKPNEIAVFSMRDLAALDRQEVLVVGVVGAEAAMHASPSA